MNPAKQDFDYWPLFCEENVWQLCRHHHFAQHKTFAVFISNETKACTLWLQQSASKQDLPVVWDYHVVLFACSEVLYNGINNGRWTVWDLDSDLALGISVEDYLVQTFLPLAPGFGHYAPTFRVVEGEVFKARFSSDRQHMKNSDGTWKSPPPSWPAIIHEEGLALAELIDMKHDECMTLDELKRAFAAKKPPPIQTTITTTPASCHTTGKASDHQPD
ncbi:MAG: hypothetical protein HRT35_16185 [Algicola sp.]|nr:hypothetical protein [Algicola sp.]